tara:strand:+ start:757 stop:978 length:222 start_codon:yes stop_codon:yes gene_type:complete
MGFVADFSSNQKVNATWNLVESTFSTTTFDFNSLDSVVLLDNTTVMSEVSVAIPTLTAVIPPTQPTYTEVTIG